MNYKVYHGSTPDSLTHAHKRTHKHTHTHTHKDTHTQTHTQRERERERERETYVHGCWIAMVTVETLLAKFVDAPCGQAAPVESKELCSWLETRICVLGPADWSHLPAAVCAWPHISWGTASFATLRCLRNSLTALSCHLITPLLQELADENTRAPWFEKLHKILVRIVGAIVRKILPGLTATNERFIFTVQGLKVAADRGSATAMLSCEAGAWLAQQRAKMDAALEAQSVLKHLGMSMNTTSDVTPQVVVHGGPDLRGASQPGASAQ
jgi:hypothetical protein